MRSIRVGPVGCKTVAKIRRTKAVAYGTPKDWSAISASTILRDGSRCTRCGCMSSVGNRLNAHHIIPVSKGGRTVSVNLKTLCNRCHAKEPGHQHMKHK